VTIRDCAFRNNIASGLGGAVYVSAFSEGAPGLSLLPAQLVVTGCSFTTNFCGGDGGAVFADGVPALIQDCAFTMNRGGSVGGAVGLLHQSHRILDSRFEGNHAPSGGAVFFSGFGTLEVEGVHFQRNSAEDYAGALYVTSANGVSVVRSWFVGNQALRGGAARFRLTAVTAEDVLWRDNTASDRGGALYLEELGSAAFLANTWIENTAAHGASITALGGFMGFDHSLFADPASDAVECHAGASITQAVCLAGVPGTGNCPNLALVRIPVTACEAVLDSLCPAPSVPGCGFIGHATESCGPQCVAPARPVTWGWLKERYR
jgi:predicted outer membrane repeat protein